ncbi:MAG: LacI family DNA-binding transcriptional regulator [Victivallales bacterium]|nr:LacI family DNA-binding transcriptional regulator [Victivallales bacterium]
MVRLKDIAGRFGVSAQAVSAVLTGRRPGCVSAQKRAAIQAYARELNYAPDAAARKLALGKTGSIGLLMPWVKSLGVSPSWGRFLEKLLPELRAQGYTLTLLPVPDKDPYRIKKELSHVVETSSVDAYLCLASFPDKRLLETLPHRGAPLVTMALPSDDVQRVDGVFSSVEIDERPAVERLATALRGQGSGVVIGFAGGVGCQRRHRLLAELTGYPFHGIPRSLPFSLYDCMGCAMEDVERNWSALSRHRVWLLQNDRMAYGAAKVIQQHGLLPGRDILLAGFDDLEEDSPDALITSVRPPYQEMAQGLAELLVSQIKAPTTTAIQRVFPARLIVRASTGDCFSNVPQSSGEF